MNNFRDIRKKFLLTEAHTNSGGDYRSGPPDSDSDPVDGTDLHMTISDLDSPVVLNRINAYLNAITMRGYMNPAIPLRNLQMKLQIIGLTVKLPMYHTEFYNGEVLELPIYRYGGRVGMHPTEGWTNDMGFNGKNYFVRLVFNVENGMYYIDCEIVEGDSSDEDFHSLDEAKQCKKKVIKETKIKITKDEGFDDPWSWETKNGKGSADTRQLAIQHAKDSLNEEEILEESVHKLPKLSKNEQDLLFHIENESEFDKPLLKLKKQIVDRLCKSDYNQQPDIKDFSKLVENLVTDATRSFTQEFDSTISNSEKKKVVLTLWTSILLDANRGNLDDLIPSKCGVKTLKNRVF